MQFLERIAAAVTATKKTKLRITYLQVLERAVSSLEVRHKGWCDVIVRVLALFRRALKWA